MKLAYISHPDCLLHDMGIGHPECPDRLKAIEQRIFTSDIAKHIARYEAPFATQEQLTLAHSQDYIEMIFHSSPSGGDVFQLDPDTSMNSHSLNAALRAAGAAIKAVDLVLDGLHAKAFCAVRPPGHHAEHSKAMGFCIFNNIAIGALHALNNRGLKRIAIVDFDVHHGNGTEDIIAKHANIMLCSTFQHPYYPFSGADSKNEHIINLPLPAGTSGDAYRRAFEASFIEKLDAFSPQLVMVSAGFDGHALDQLANFNLYEEDYAWITQQIKLLADTHANGRVVSVLEGGYQLPVLASSVYTHLGALINTRS